MGPFNPYREWLGLEAEAAPDHYILLSLTAFAADPGEIAAAAMRAATRVRSFRPGANAREWSRLLDEIQSAKDCLCDPQRKAEYDDALRRGTSPPSSVFSPLPGPGSARIRTEVERDLYPPGVSSTADAERFKAVPATEFSLPPAAESQAELPIPAEATPAAEPVANLGAWAELPPPHDNPLAVSLSHGASPFVAPNDAAVPAFDPPAADVSMPEALSRRTAAPNRARRPAWSLAIACAGGLAVVVVAGVAYDSFFKRALSPALTAKADPPPQTPAAAAKVRGSNSRPATPAVSPPAGGMAPGRPMEPSPEDFNPLSPPATVAATSPPEPAPEPTVATQPLPAPAPAPLPSSAAAPPELPKVSRVEIQALIKALEAAKAAYADHNFKAAELQIAKAESLAKLPQHQQVVARLKAAGSHVQQFRQAIVEAVKNMEAGSTFKVGNSTQVAFVEGYSDKVILRIAGMNRTYAFNDLPPGLAVVIADFKLPSEDPQSRILKGAYLLLHKRADSETQNKARSLWEEARAAGAQIDHLLPLLDERYTKLLSDATG